MKSSIYILSFNGKLLQRGFWLYVWEIVEPGGMQLYYVGRTGDSSSVNAQSPFNRLGQHLGFTKASNMLRQHLQSRGIAVEKCNFRFVAYGPIIEEATTRDEHRKRRDLIAALEKALAVAFKDAGYEVLNTVECRKEPDQNLWKSVSTAFASYFPRLNHPSTHRRTGRS